MNQLRSTLVLLVIVGGLGYATYLASGPEPTEADLTEAALDGRSLLEASRIDVRTQLDVQPIELHRVGGYAFELAEPVRDVAAASRIESVAGVWDGARLARAFEPEDVTDELLQQFGLDRPRGELRAVYPDREIHLEFGDDGAMGHDLYVRRDGVIYFASKALFTVLQGTANDFREPHLFVNQPGQVRKITVLRRESGADYSRLVLRQVQPGRYMLEEPIAARAYLAGAESFVANLLGLKVGIYERGNMMPQPTPDWTIEVDGVAGVEKLRLWRQPNTMLLGVQEPRQLAFLIEDRDYSRMFDVPAEMMRSRLLVPRAVTEIDHVKLDPGLGQRAAVLRRGRSGVLEVEEPVRKATNPTATGKLLKALASMTVEEFVPGEPEDLAPFGLDAGYFTVEVRASADPRPIVVHLGATEGDHCYVRRADERNVVKVSADAIRDLRQPWVDYVDRQVYRYPAINVVELRYSRGEQSASFRRDSDGGWSGPDGAVSSDDIESAVETLTHLDARKVLDPADAGASFESPLNVQVMGLNGVVFVQMSLFVDDRRTLLTLPGVDLVYELREADAAVIGRLAPN